MARKIGEFLIEANKLTSRQLQEALRSQRIFGGTLGTHLVELGFVSESDLVEALGAIHEVPGVSRETLLQSPPEVVALLSPEFAKRHRAIPYQVDGDDLYLAMQNPADSLAAHEAAFLTGFNVVPCVSTEKVVREMLKQLHRLEAPPSRPPSPQRSRGVQVDGSTTAPQPVLARERESGSPPDPPIAAPALSELGDRLSRVQDRDELLDLMLGEMTQFLPRAAVFALRSGVATLHRSMQMGLDGKREISVSLAESSVLSIAADAGKISYGPVAPTPANQDLYTLLGGRLPRVALSVPVMIKGRAVALLYGDSLQEPPQPPNFRRLQLLQELAAMALEIVILRSKIARKAKAGSD